MEPEAKKTSVLTYVKFDNVKVPEFKKVSGKDWIYWGEDNDYPDYLIDLFMRSSTHNAIVTGKVNYILGNGWTAKKQGLSTDELAKLNAFISQINSAQTLNELCEGVVLDFEMFNAIPMEVIWNKAKSDFELHHVPLNKIRTNEDKTAYWYSKDWNNTNQSAEKTGLKEYKPFDFDKKENGLFIYQITAPRKGKDPNVYPTPEYVGSTQAIETDAECSNYNLSEIKTGFSAGTILNFYNGIPTPEEIKVIEKQIKSKFSGTDRAGGLMLNFADGKERGTEVVALSGNDLDKRYVELKKDVRQEIFTGHKVSSPMLFGVKTEGQLGGRAEIEEAYELFQNTYVSKRQRILEKIFNKFAKLKGLRANLEIKPTSAIGFGIPDSLIAQAMSIDFVKEKLGIPVLKDSATTGAKAVIDAINSLSPLVANKVLESMSAEEIRSLVGLAGPVTTTTQTTSTQMSKDKDLSKSIIEKFATIGRRKSDYNIYKSKCLFHANTFSVAKAEKEYFRKKDDLTGLDRSILDLLNKDNKIPVEEIAKALKTDVKTIQTEVNKMVELEYLSPSKETTGEAKISSYEPSADAIDIIDNEGVKTINVEILYSYELRPNAPKLIGESREFCASLMEMDFLYTRDEIDNLSNEFGTDVWTFKGGWYTNPNTDAPTPQCRHTFVQHVVKRKN